MVVVDVPRSQSPKDGVGYGNDVDRLFDAIEARESTRGLIKSLVRAVADFETGLGITPYLDSVIGERARRVANVLQKKSDPLAERDLLCRLVRDAGRDIAAGRRLLRDLAEHERRFGAATHFRDLATNVATLLAEEIIEKCSRADRELIPFGDRIAEFRAELVAAIGASARRVRAPKGADRAADAMGHLIRKMGFQRVTPRALRGARERRH